MTTKKKTAKKRTRKPVKPAAVKPQESSQEGIAAFIDGSPPTLDDWRREAKYLQERIDAMRNHRDREDMILGRALHGTGCSSLRPATARGALIVALGALQLSQAQSNAIDQQRLDMEAQSNAIDQQRLDMERLFEEQIKRADAATREKMKLLDALSAWAKDYFAEGDPARDWLQKTLGVNFVAAEDASKE